MTNFNEPQEAVAALPEKKAKHPSFQSPRGTRDILPVEQKYWQTVKQRAETTARNFGYLRLDLPSLENAGLFDRGIGSNTDLISKELYLVISKEDLSLEKSTSNLDINQLLSLRPEFTAGVIRSYIQNGLHTLPQPLKLYTSGSIFRHEKPQKNRYREHYQLDFEILGDDSAKADAWVILSAWQFLESLGLKNVEMQVNSLGNSSSQENYRTKLTAYYQPKVEKLCSVCQVRFKTNILRLLDCKETECLKFKEEAPKTIDSLDEKSGDHFMSVLSLLDSFGVAYHLNPLIVRGLDYYSHTAFEIMINKEDLENLGGRHQVALGGGGRYDSLVEKLGGQVTTGVGVGIGLDRVVEEMKSQKVQVPHLVQTEIFVVGVGAKAMSRATNVVTDLLKAGFAVECAPDKNSFSNQLRQADKLEVIYSIIIGEKEAKDNTCIIRDMKSGIQEDAKMDELVSIFNERLRK